MNHDRIRQIPSLGESYVEHGKGDQAFAPLGRRPADADLPGRETASILSFADAVLLGRLYMWALAVAGEDGAREVIQNFVADFDLTMALNGYSSCSDLDESALIGAEG